MEIGRVIVVTITIKNSQFFSEIEKMIIESNIFNEYKF